MAREMLTSLGYKVTATRSGSEAWGLFLQDPAGFDLVITDQAMPEVTGTALAIKMLRVRGDLPVILYTAYDETATAEKAKEAGISALVMKPMAKQELAEAIRRVLDGRKGNS